MISRYYYPRKGWATRMGETSTACPLCGSRTGASRYQKRMKRHYHWCSNCDLVSVPTADHISPEAERDRYLSHNNSLEQTGYVEMLSTVLDTAENAAGRAPFDMLDYGCGYAPVLGQLAAQRGHAVSNYDPVFFPAPVALESNYTVVTCCEVAEHARNPRDFWMTLSTVVLPGGVLVVRSSLHPDDWNRFLTFWYTYDETHISFYSEICISHVCRTFGFELVSVHDPLWVLRKT